MTNYNLIDAIGLALKQAVGRDCYILYIIAIAIKKNFLLKGKSSLIKIAIFNYSLIKLINYINLSYLRDIIFLA
jgi:hypothetical protein